MCFEYRLRGLAHWQTSQRNLVDAVKHLIYELLYYFNCRKQPIICEFRGVRMLSEQIYFAVEKVRS